MSSTAYDDQYSLDDTMIGNITISLPTTGNTSNSLDTFTIGNIATANVNLNSYGGGASGSVYVSSVGWANVNTHSTSTTMLSIMAENKGDAIIKTNKHKINLDEMADVVETLKERLLILTPAFEKHEKYPALKEAYDHYKLIEALCKEEDTK